MKTAESIPKLLPSPLTAFLLRLSRWLANPPVPEPERVILPGLTQYRLTHEWTGEEWPFACVPGNVELALRMYGHDDLEPEDREALAEAVMVGRLPVTVRLFWRLEVVG